MRGIFVGLAVITLVGWLVGCGSHAKFAGTNAAVDVVAANSSRLLHGRLLAVDLREPHNNWDIWVVARGRGVDVTKKVRVATGGNDCYGSDYGGGQGPCYELAEPFSLSRDGRHLAFFLMDTSGAPDATPPALIVSRSDGSLPHRVAESLGICVLCHVSTPSWDRNGRSFVIGVEQFAGNDLGSTTKIYRVAIRSGKPTLLSPGSMHAYSEDEPAVSPDGTEIALFRNAARGLSSGTARPPAYVYLMRANGSGRRRLPLPRHAYTAASYLGHNALWWSSSTTVCAGSLASTYCFDLGTGHITRRQHWAESSYSGLSADGSFAIRRRKTPRGWEVLGGPVNGAGVAKFAPVLAATHAREDPFSEFSLSGP